MDNESNTMKEAIELHALYREKVTHEDGLINQRTNWFITLEALLFAAFGFLFEDFRGHATGNEYLFIFLIFASLGISACYTTFLGVSAALNAIDDTNKKWEKLKYPENIMDKLPAIRGGGLDQGLFKIGAASSIYLPSIVGIGWLIIIFIVLFERCGTI